MALRALLAFVALPGIFAVALPPLVAAVDPWRGATSSWGHAVQAIGAAVLLACVRDFYVTGRGTLAPWDPPRRLVIVGLYRRVRNPMYLGVVLLVLGWSLARGSPLVAAYAAALALAFHLRVVRHEEPSLARRFPVEWAVYAASVRRWLPRCAPWRDDARAASGR